MEKDPIRIFNIKYSNQDRERVHNLVDQVLDEAFLSNHTLCRELESKINSLQDSKYSIATTSATTGLEAIFRTINVKGKAVIVQSNTFIATAHAIEAAGGIIIPLDLNNEFVASYQDSIEAYNLCIEKGLEVAAVCIVHIAGRCSSDIFKIKEFFSEKNIYLVEDNAQGFLSKINEKYLGSIGDYSVTSFQTTKVVACGEGGVISCRTIANEEKIRNNIFFGKSSTKPRIFENISGNFKLSEMNSALILSDLERCEKRIERRKYIDNMYKKHVSSEKLFYLNAPEANFPSYYKTLFLAIDQSTREKIEINFKENAIAMTGSVYREPISIQPRVINSKNYLHRELKNTKTFCSRHFAPPNYPELKDSEVQRIIDTLNSL